MIKVIDFNAISSKKRPLEAFFEAPDNIAVVSDFMAFECLKRDGSANFRKSFASFEPHAHRVVVLKDFTELQRLPPRKAGFYDAIVDAERTRLFPTYCHQMLHVNHPQIEATIRIQQERVQSFMDKIEMLTSQEYRISISDLERSVSEEQRKQWRSGNPVTPEELEFAKGMVVLTTRS